MAAQRRSQVPANMHQGSAQGAPIVQSITHTVAHCGPLPSADEMEKYRDISPDWPERIMAMAEKEQEARLAETRKRSEREDGTICLAQMESNRADKLLALNSRFIARGQIFAFLCFLVFIMAVVWCAQLKLFITAGFLGSGGFVMLVAVFIIGSQIRASSSHKK